MVEGHSTRGLIIISTLYKEGRIDDDQREQLKEMIFSEDAILLSLLERYDDEQDIKDAVLSYCNRGAVSSSAAQRDKRPVEKSSGGGFSMFPQQQLQQQVEVQSTDASDLEQLSSPSDSALDLMKRKRLNQIAAKQKQEAQQQLQQQQQQQQTVVPQASSAFVASSSGGAFAIADCDLGASPVMKGGIFSKPQTQHNKMVSPLAGARMLFMNKTPSSGGPPQ